MAFDPSNVDVEHFLESLGIENITKATQHEMRFSCPYPNHAGGDESPSAYMNIDTSQFYCHGCKEKGDAVSFAAFVLQVSPLEAIRNLRQAYQPGGLDPDAVSMQEIWRKHKAKLAEEDPAQPILDESELESREIDWADAWCTYDQTGSAYPCDYMFERGFTPEAMMDHHIGWDMSSGRFTIPVRDIDCNLIGFKARTMDPNRKPKYLVLGDKEGERPRYGFSRYYPSRVVYAAHLITEELKTPLVVCEGEFNAIATMQKTDYPAVAINGSHFHHTHAKIIKRVAGEDGIILFLDEDSAGLDCMWGRWDSQGRWHPGIVEMLSPFMPVRVISGHDKDAADLDGDDILRLLEDSVGWLVAKRSLGR